MLNQYVLNASGQPELCFIWMHGLGADAQNMLALAKEIPLRLPAKHIALEAPMRPVTCNQSLPMRAWYDIVGFSEKDREDQAGIEASMQEIHRVIDAQIAEGFKPEQIVLAGFSQGGAMALVAGLSSPHRLLGLVSLSAYLPLAQQLQIQQSRQTPIFMALGLHDEVVLPAWTKNAVAYLKTQEFEHIAEYQFPMQHTVCFEEIAALSHWISIHAPIKKESIGSAHDHG